VTIGTRARGSSLSPLASPLLQRSLVKVSFVSGTKPGGFRSHGAYLSRKGGQKEHERGKGFDGRTDDVYLPDRFDEWQRVGDKRLWKIVVSPEAAERVDLQGHARDLVRAIEDDLGVRLEWAAIDHHDTDHAHVHIAIRGVDRDGREFRMPRDYVREGIRARSQELLTRELGLRREHDRIAAREHSLEAPRFTELDRELARRASPDGRVSVYLDRGEGEPLLRARQEIRRLLYLRSLGLAQHISKREWQLDPKLEASLRELQIAGDVQKSLWRGGVGATDGRAPTEVTTLAPGAHVRGRVVGTGYSESAGRAFVVVEGTDGRRHILRDERVLSASRAPGVIRPGSVATIRKTDQGVVQVLAHGRIGDLKRTPTASTALDLDALAWIRAEQPERASDSRPRGFHARWWHAVRERVPVLERAGLVRRQGVGENARLIVAPGAERQVEQQSNAREHSRIKVAEIEPRFGKPTRLPADTPARTHEGRVVAYAVDDSDTLHVAIDTGKHITLVPVAERSLPIGNRVRARTQAHEDEHRRRVAWSLDDLEHARDLSRGR
jgi:type IV secretory pathway VirD2 relaxase